MVSNVSTTDGLGFEEVNQEVTFTEVISGTNIYGTTGSFGNTRIVTANITTGNITNVIGATISGTTIRGTNMYGTTIVSGATIKGDVVSGTTYQGATAIISTGSFVTIRNTNATVIGSVVGNINGDITGNVTGSVVDSDGSLRSTLLGSATTNVWGGFIQAGSFNTNAGSQGVISFGTAYSSNNNYYLSVVPMGSVAGFETSYVSGLKNASGADFVGAASLRYDWIAVGN